MGLAFGTQDEIECLTGQKFDGPHGDQVCLASKISLHFVGAGVYVSDGGYVLKITGSKSYYSLNAAQLTALQAEGLVPTPLPSYHISAFQYAFGYSLWIVVAIIGLFAIMKKVFGKLEPFLKADVAPVTGPPVVRTDDDRWLAAELQKHLQPGEQVQHQAYGTNFEPGSTPGKAAKYYYAALTDQRLLFLEDKIGFRGLKREIVDVVAWPREIVLLAEGAGLRVILHTGPESYFVFFVQGSQRKFTNQWLFARDVPKLLAAEIARRAAA